MSIYLQLAITISEKKKQKVQSSQLTLNFQTLDFFSKAKSENCHRTTNKNTKNTINITPKV